MKKIGIVGGIGPESTIDYYRGIIYAFHDRYLETGYPEIAIESCNLKETHSYSANNDLHLLASLLIGKFKLLINSGCDFGVIASNTPHIIFNEIQEKITLPLLSIVEATSMYALQKGYKKLCLLGTGFTMKSDFYQKVFSKHKIELIVPAPMDIEYIHDKIFSELEFGIVKKETKNKFIEITNKIIKENNCDGAIMGCTELPLIIKEEDISGEYLNTTSIHISNIIEECQKMD